MKNKINELKVKASVDKDQFYKKLHIYEGSETFTSSDLIFCELEELISSMEITSLYIFTDIFPLDIEEDVEKYVICYISSDTELNSVANDFMARGKYLKSYLLSEMVAYAIFKASDEMNKKINRDIGKCGYRLANRYAAGDGNIDLRNQGKFFDELKKYISIDAYLNDENMIVPLNSLLYIYTIIKGVGDYISDCSKCTNINCIYKKHT